MDEVSYTLMKRLLDSIEWPSAEVLDVGSLDVNGTYRPIVESRGWSYLGLDIVSGPNVDVVAEEFSYPFEDGRFDIVISGTTMEHVTAIWLWVPELVRILRPGGLLAIVAPWKWAEHRYPVDCWRIMPDGMNYLFDLSGLRDGQVWVHEGGLLLGFAYKLTGGET